MISIIQSARVRRGTTMSSLHIQGWDPQQVHHLGLRQRCCLVRHRGGEEQVEGLQGGLSWYRLWVQWRVPVQCWRWMCEWNWCSETTGTAPERCVVTNINSKHYNNNFSGPLAVTLDEIPSETNIKRAPFCPVGAVGKTAPDACSCRCTKEPTVKGLDGNLKGGCVPPLKYEYSKHYFRFDIITFQRCWYWGAGIRLVFPGKCWASWKPHRELLRIYFLVSNSVCGLLIVKTTPAEFKDMKGALDKSTLVTFSNRGKFPPPPSWYHLYIFCRVLYWHKSINLFDKQ